MTKGLVSVIIAAYNAEDTLPRCLDSVMNQTYHSLEIIVVNDGSTDGTQNLLDDYASKDHRIILLKEETNCGAPAARNNGMEVSCGEFMAVIDADDAIDPNTLELSVKELMEDDELDLVTFDMIMVEEDSERRLPFKTNPEVPSIMTGTEACYWSIQYDFAPNGVSRSPLEQSMPATAEGGQHSDEAITHLILLKSRKVKLGKGKYYYYMRPTSVTHKVSVRRFDILESRIVLKQMLQKENADDKTIRRVDEKRWKEFIGMCHFFWLRRDDFSKEEQDDAMESLSKTYDTFHWRDLPLTTVLKPRFMLLPTFTMFYIQVSVVFALNLVRL